MSSRPLVLLVGILAVVLVGWVLHVGAGILQPLVIALLLCSMLQPVVRSLARLYVPPAVTVIALVVLLFLGLTWVADSVQVQLRDYFSSPDAIGWTTVKHELVSRLRGSALPGTFDKFIDMIESSLNELDMKGLATNAIGTGFGFVRVVLLVVIYMMFIFAEQAVFRRKILAVAGSRHEDAAEVIDTISRGIQRYLGVKTAASFLTASLCYAVLLALNVRYAELFAILTFFLNYIPTFGSIVAGILASLSAVAFTQSLNVALLVAATYAAVNVGIGSFLEPKILGRELNLSPLVILISVVVWAGLWGAVGTFLAVPITATIQIVLAGNETTRPIAVLLSSGPPREDSKPPPPARGSQAAPPETLRS